METGKNHYEKKARKKSLLGEITAERATDENLKNSAIETAKDLVVGAVGGGIVGAMLGKFSLVAGTGITFLSHYFKKHMGQLGRAFGIALMSSGSYENLPTKTVSGTEEENKGVIDGATERVMNFKERLSEKLFLDKILKKKEGDKKETTKQVSSSNGTQEEEKPVGEVKYLLVPNKNGNENDLNKLDEVVDELHQSAHEYTKSEGTQGTDESEMGDTELDPTERNY